MQMLLHGELAPWYRPVDPPEHHGEEAGGDRAALERAASPPPETLLELGAGARHDALRLKRRFRCTLADLSEEMLAPSRELNPDREHLRGGLRAPRIGRAFGAVLVHDAAMSMTTEGDLAAAARTAFVHTRPVDTFERPIGGGAVDRVFVCRRP